MYKCSLKNLAVYIHLIRRIKAYLDFNGSWKLRKVGEETMHREREERYQRAVNHIEDLFESPLTLLEMIVPHIHYLVCLERKDL